MISDKFRDKSAMSVREAKRICENAGYKVTSPKLTESKEYVIWSDFPNDLMDAFKQYDWEEYQDPMDSEELSYEDKMKIVAMDNDEFLYDEKLTLKNFHGNCNTIIAIHTHNTWNGKFDTIETVGDLEDILAFSGDYDYFKVYFDGEDVKGEAGHHDGRNKILFRELKTEMDDEEFEDFENTLKYGSKEEREECLDRHTRSLSRIMKAVYGW